MFWTASYIMYSKHDYLARLKCSNDCQKRVVRLPEHIPMQLLMQLLNVIFSFKRA